ncbi:MAG: type III PLP-dependent enzyme [Alphaproteobacteria bacterium]|nr:type III PLP-dependent enzyme [Alphaproteobacteria bacterium]
MDHIQSLIFPSPSDAVRSLVPEGPLAIARPHRVKAAGTWFRENFPGEIFYAVKANPSPWVLDALWESGVRGFDVASEAEVRLISERFGKDAKLAFMHPVKSRRAIGRAYLDYGVRTFVLDTEDELQKILIETNGAKDLTLMVRLAVSNDGASLPLASKFGVSAQDAPDLLRKARSATEEMMGISFHVGSQCMRPLAYKAAMLDANRAIIKAGVVVDIVDVGGGFPAIYPGMEPPEMGAYMREIRTTFEEMFVAQNAVLWSEPGRALVAEAGSIVTRVDLRKGDALYLNDGAYGNLFDATHVQWPFPVKHIRDGGSRAKLAPFKFYGPTCDSMDAAQGPFLLPADIREGDHIEIGMLGAYGVAMSTGFNGFGDTTTVVSEDAPWQSMFVAEQKAAEAADDDTGVVRLSDRRRKPKRR